MSITCPKCGHVRTESEDLNTPSGQCPACGVYYAKVAPKLTNVVDAPVDDSQTLADRLRRLKSIQQGELKPNTFAVANLVLACLGAAMMAIGSFMPILSLGKLGTMTYFNNGHGDGVFLLVASVLIVISAFLRRRELVGWIGSACLILLSVTLFFSIVRIEEAKRALEDGAHGNMFGGLLVAMSQSIGLQWGWAVMFVGVVIVIVAAMLEDSWLKKNFGR